jgi:hypothetical protein
MDETMDSIKTILRSEKFLREAPDRLEHLIRRIQREDSETAATAFSPLPDHNSVNRENRQSNVINIETKKKNVA